MRLLTINAALERQFLLSKNWTVQKKVLWKENRNFTKPVYNKTVYSGFLFKSQVESIYSWVNIYAEKKRKKQTLTEQNEGKYSDRICKRKKIIWTDCFKA